VPLDEFADERFIFRIASPKEVGFGGIQNKRAGLGHEP
jgi:hypothetical protein